MSARTLTNIYCSALLWVGRRSRLVFKSIKLCFWACGRRTNERELSQSVILYRLFFPSILSSGRNNRLSKDILYVRLFLILLYVCCFQQNTKGGPVVENGNSYPETKTISTENGSIQEAQDKDVVSEGIGSVGVYDKWIAPPVSGQHPKARYEVLGRLIISWFCPFSPPLGSEQKVLNFQHGAAVIQDKMYIYGGNHNGRYLNDLHVSNLFSLATIHICNYLVV